jgi:hypothetical protein
MKKYYLVNMDVLEAAYFASNEEALQEAQRRNRYDKHANWKAYDESGYAIHAIVFC